MKRQTILKQTAQYYTRMIAAHGPSPLGVAWSSSEVQELRFRQLLKVAGDCRDCSFNDYGCGYGALIRLMRAEGYQGPYIGYDISEVMIEQAWEQQSDVPDCVFVTDSALLPQADYTVASGIFNIKLDTPRDEWEAYITDTIATLAAHSKRGFAFNMLKAHPDPQRVNPHLYFGDPNFYIDYCSRELSSRVAMLGDYGLYDFTILAWSQ